MSEARSTGAFDAAEPALSPDYDRTLTPHRQRRDATGSLSQRAKGGSGCGAASTASRLAAAGARSGRGRDAGVDPTQRGEHHGAGAMNGATRPVFYRLGA